MIKILIPSNNIFERKYILDVIFNEFLGLRYSLEIGSESYEIVLENGKILSVKDTFFNNYPSDLEYLKLDNIPRNIEELDMFSASFFMLTRWEEHVIKKRDIHDRFPATESLAFKNNFLDRPIVNEYVENLKILLLKLDNNLVFKKHKYKLYLTHDIDIPLKHSDTISNTKEIIGDIIKRRDLKLAFRNLSSKIKTTLNLQKDPFDTFDYIMDISESIKVKSYFFLCHKV